YLPYTGMCVCFSVAGSLLAGHIAWDRLVAIAVIYFLGLGISAHAADALGSKQRKPWGAHFSKDQLRILIIAPLSVAYLIGAYYAAINAPLLGTALAITEGFFLFAYNFELFGGRFHNDYSFSIAWGCLPLISGYVIQTGNIDLVTLAAAAVAGA